MLDFFSNLYELFANKANAKKKKQQKVPKAKVAVSSLKGKAIAILQHSLFLWPLANYL